MPKGSNSCDRSKSAESTDIVKTPPVVGIGASAGGLEAFKLFFNDMPAKTGIAFVLIPHLDPGHKSLMVEIISRHTSMPTLQVEQPMDIEPDHIYVVPPNRNLGIENGRLVPYEIYRQKGLNMPVDAFFQSLAAALKERAIAVILSGTMRDGTMGIRDIKEHGGLVLAQAPETAQHDGMPQSAINTGIVDLVLPVDKMQEAILNFISHPYMHGNYSFQDEDELNQVLAVINARFSHDFRCYKRNTLIRRTERRMGLRQIEKMADYVEVIKAEPDEITALMKDLLIGVTNFFREDKVWEKLSTEIQSMVLKKTEHDIPLRVWIPACSTGEEAYTISILLHEAFAKVNQQFNAQIFATDMDEDAIIAARSGSYPESISTNVPEEYLKKYFVHEDHSYRILRKIRESVVFAVQNLIGDAPFSQLDMISCRNLLIYLEPGVQKKVIQMFHFSLREGGYLVLGSSETIGYYHNLFETISKNLRIYRSTGRKDERVQIPILSGMSSGRGLSGGVRPKTAKKSLGQVMQNQLLKEFAPASILINKTHEIVNLFGPTEKYLHMPQGDPTMDLMAIIRDGLRIKMRAAVHKAIKTDDIVEVSGARVKRDSHFYPVGFSVRPVTEKDFSEPLFLISFEEEGPKATVVQGDIAEGEESLVRQLENELVTTRDDLQNTIEELETSNEELKASNEEMMSMNEELQSSNEELETSKEELQSLNEELNTVNSELKEKISEVESTNNDLINLMNSTEVATVFLDLQARIRRFTPSAKKLFNLIETDLGRPISDLSQRFSDDQLGEHTQQVIETLVPMSKEVENETGQWFVRHILPFRTQDNRLEGVVLTFVDVTELKRIETELLQSNEMFEHAEAVANVGSWEWEIKPDRVYWSKELFRIFGRDPSKGAPSFAEHPEIYVDEDMKLLEETVKKCANQGTSYELELRAVRPDGEIRHCVAIGQAKTDANGEIVRLAGSFQDITERKKIEFELIRSNEVLAESQRIAQLGSFEYVAATKGTIWSEEEYRIYGLDPAGPSPDYDIMLQKCIHPEDADMLHDTFMKAMKDKTIYELEHRIVRPDGEVRWVYDQAHPYFDKQGELINYIGSTLDITDRKQSEEVLRKQNYYLSKAQELGKIGSWELDLTDNKIIWTDENYRIFGSPQGSVVTYETFLKKVHPDDREYVDREWNAAIEGTPYDIEHRLLIDNEVKWVREKAEFVYDNNGKVIKAIGLTQDITRKKEAEQKTLILQTAIEQAPIGIALADPNINIYYSNPAGLRIRGGHPDTLVDISQEAFDNWQVHKLTGEPYEIEDLPLVRAIKKRKLIQEQFIVKHDDKIDRICDAIAYPVFENSEIIAGLIIFNDVTEQERMEADIRQIQKMESVGNLAGGIAHEFNNILSIIIGNTELALGDIPKMNSAADNIQEILTASLRAKGVVQKLLNFARKSPSQRKPIQIGTIVKDSLYLLRKTIPTTIDIRQNIVCSDEMILGDDNDISQVIMNLCTNSVHAMRDQTGLLEINLETTHLDNQTAKRHKDLKPGKYVKLTVKDSGQGIKQELIEQVFEPYFTTKDVDEGLGMGLAVVHGIVKEHEGAIKIESEVGKGTTIGIFFPLIENQTVVKVQETDTMLTGTERILIVDDESSLVKMYTRMLEQFGYTVLGKTSSVDALKIFKEDPEGFDLVITDMAMPDMAGDQLAKQIMHLRPDTPIILCTGHNDCINERRGMELGIKALLMKPIEKAELNKIIRRVLDEATN